MLVLPHFVMNHFTLFIVWNYMFLTICSWGNSLRNILDIYHISLVSSECRRKANCQNLRWSWKTSLTGTSSEAAVLSRQKELLLGRGQQKCISRFSPRLSCQHICRWTLLVVAIFTRNSNTLIRRLCYSNVYMCFVFVKNLYNVWILYLLPFPTFIPFFFSQKDDEIEYSKNRWIASPFSPIASMYCWL